MSTTVSGDTGVSKVQSDTVEVVDLKSEAKPIGIDQTWQNVTTSRAAGVDYVNNTGRAIQVGIITTGTSGAFFRIDGVIVYRNSATTAYTTCMAIVPPGSTYTLETGASIVYWNELR